MTADTTVLHSNISVTQDYSFIAMQFVLSSHPDDPLRERMRRLVQNIQQTTGPDDVVTSVRALMQALSANLSLIEYCVWDYSLVSTVANTEFKSWVSGIREAREESASTDEVDFQADYTSYCVVTFALRSKHSSLNSWLKFFPEHLDAEKYFQRKTIQTILERFSSNESSIVAQSSEVLCEMMPKDDTKFYSAYQLQHDKDWDYLRPMY